MWGWIGHGGSHDVGYVMCHEGSYDVGMGRSWRIPQCEDGYVMDYPMIWVLIGHGRSYDVVKRGWIGHGGSHNVGMHR